MSCPHFCTDDPTGEITSNTDIVLYFKILVYVKILVYIIIILMIGLHIVCPNTAEC